MKVQQPTQTQNVIHSTQRRTLPCDKRSNIQRQCTSAKTPNITRKAQDHHPRRNNKTQGKKHTVGRKEKKRHHKQSVSASLTKLKSLFVNKIKKGPSYVCTSCHQTWFRHSVNEYKSSSSHCYQMYDKYTTKLISVDGKEWLCNTCSSYIKKGKIPRWFIANHGGFHNKPYQLDLCNLEQRLISPRIPFMQIRELPRGGQLSLKGNVVNVPVDVMPTVTALPRNLPTSETIAVKLKKTFIIFITCLHRKCKTTKGL